MERIEYFDYMGVAKKMGVPDITLRKIKKEVKKEFPRDKMMFELHTLRAIKSEVWRTQKQNQH